MAMFKPDRIKPVHQTRRQKWSASPQIRGVAVAACALLLVACQSNREVTGSVEQDYRLRHPIMLQQSARTIDIPVGVNSERLTPSSQSALEAFARDFLRENASVIQVMVPSGSLNETSANYMAKQIRGSLMRQGVAAGRIDLFPYTAANASDAPIRLAYPRVEAKTLTCGSHPAGFQLDTQNYDYFDFGCSTQQNLAAAVANPQDLIQPRGYDPRDAQRRSAVSEAYRSGQKTWSADLDSNSGTSSEVSK
nr:CpaD family pilus assembly protein [uncultured Cohaesibacter sp.]